MTDLETQILEIINKTIDGKYISKLRVVMEEDWYYLLLYMNQEQSPLVMAYQGNEDKFKLFVQTEFKNRKMERMSYWKATQELPSVICKNGQWDYDYYNDLIV